MSEKSRVIYVETPHVFIIRIPEGFTEDEREALDADLVLLQERYGAAYTFVITPSAYTVMEGDSREMSTLFHGEIEP